MKYTGAMFGRLYSQKNATSQCLAPAAVAFLMFFLTGVMAFGSLVLGADTV